MYKNYIFDFYGTLADIHTDEQRSSVWEKMALFYGYYRARYEPGELKEAYENLVRMAERRAAGMFQKEVVLRTGNEAARMYRNRAESIDGATEKSLGGSYEGNPEICLDKVFRQLFTDRGIQPQECLVLHAGQFFRVLTTDYIRLYEGVPQMLKRLRQKGRTVCLLTNAQRIFTEYELQLLGIAECFDKILISSDYGMKKPDIRFFQMLLDSCRLEAGESLMIGNDAVCDIAGAKKAGMDAYYVHSNLSPEYAADVDADYIQMEMDISVLCRVLGI